MPFRDPVPQPVEVEETLPRVLPIPEACALVIQLYGSATAGFAPRYPSCIPQSLPLFPQENTSMLDILWVEEG